MQIQLKQPELEQAIQQYLSSRGLALEGKAVGIAFAMTRKPAGIAATVKIEDQVMAGQPSKQTLRAVESAAPKSEVSDDSPEPTEGEEARPASLFG